MPAEQVVIEIDGAEAGDLYPDLAWVSVDTGDDMAAMFRFELKVSQQPDGTWSHVDDDRLQLWRRVLIGAGFADEGTEPVTTGYITHVLPVFDADPARCRLQVWGMDATVLLEREEKLRAWPDQSDSDIASAVIAEHGLTADVTATEVVHDERVSTVMQRETDAALLRRLAARNGYECYVDGDGTGDTVRFGPVTVTPAERAVLAVHFGDETSLVSLAVRATGPGPTAVTVSQLDRTSKEVVTVAVQDGEREPLGASPAADLLAGGVLPARAFLTGSPTTGEQEMQALARAGHERGQWFVTADALVDGNRYGSVLRPRQSVLVKGAGDTHSGEYEVLAVHHRMGIDGYQQHARLRRNALGLTGREDFAPAAGGLL